MLRQKPKSTEVVHLLKSYPEKDPVLLKNHDYQIGARLQIGYFVFMSGRLVFLPIDLRGHTYEVRQKAAD